MNTKLFFWFTIVLVHFFALNVYSQNEMTNWYFGYDDGITFNTKDKKPVAITDVRLVLGKDVPRYRIKTDGFCFILTVQQFGTGIML